MRWFLRVLTLFVALSVSAETVVNFISPSAPTLDTYPTHKAIFGKGGLMTGLTNVSQLTDTTALGIPTQRREAGMTAYLTNGTAFRLAADLLTWSPADPAISVTNVAAFLSNSAEAYAPNTVFNLAGYYQQGDGGGGEFYYDRNSSAATNLGTIFAPPSGTGRYIRIIPDGEYNIQWFGALGDNTFDSTQAITNCIGVAGARGVNVPFGKYKITAPIDLLPNAVTSGHILKGQVIGGAFSTLTTNAQCSSFIQWTDNTPILRIAGTGGHLSDLVLAFRNVQDNTNTAAVGIQATNGIVFAWNINGIAFEKVNTAIHVPSDTFWVSNTASNLRCNRFSLYGLFLEGGGTHNKWENVYLRGFADIESQSGTGISNTDTNVTVTGLSSGFTSQMMVGQLVSITGVSPVEYTGFFTLRGFTTTTATYTLSSNVVTPVSGAFPTIQIFAKYLTNGYGVYTGPGQQSVFDVLNLEWFGGNGAAWFTGITEVNGLHIEGFQARNSIGNIVRSDQPCMLNKVEIINCAIATNAFWTAFYQAGAHRLQVNALQVRDTYLNPGAFWWAGNTPNASAHVSMDGPPFDSTFRWDRTGSFTSWGEMEEDNPARKEFNTSGTFQYGVNQQTIVNQSGTAGFVMNYRNLLATNYGSSARFFDLSANNGTNVYALSDQGALTVFPVGSRFLDYGGSTNASRIRLSAGDTTSDRVLDLTGNTIQSAKSSDGTPQTLAINPLGGNVTFGQGTPAQYIFGGGSQQSGALVTMSSTTMGFSPPFMTQTQVDAISAPAAGMLVYDTTTANFEIRRNAQWYPFGASYVDVTIPTNGQAITGRNTFVLVQGSGIRTNSLPSAILWPGKRITFKDGNGNSGTGPIWITSAAGNIDGSAFDAIVVNYGTRTYISDGSNWYRESQDANGASDAILSAPAMGSVVKAHTIGASWATATTSVLLSDGTARLCAVWLPKATVLTGVKFIQATAGSYTADNNNRIGLYSYSGGTITLVASTADRAALWTAAAGAVVAEPFSSTYSAAPGLYFVDAVYNSSAQTTQPAISGIPAVPLSAILALDYTSSTKLSGFSSETDLPATKAMSGITASTGNLLFMLY